MFNKTKRVLVFDGVDGVGKTTLIKNIADTLRREGYSVEVFTAIGGGPIGKVIRSRFLADKLDLLGEALLATTCHWELNVDTIPNSTADYVLVDRWLSSNYVYQYYIPQATHVSTGLGADTVLKLFDTLLNVAHRPDIIFNLTVSEETSRSRLVARGDDLNRLDRLPFKLKVEGFEEFMDIYEHEYGGNVVNVSCEATPDKVLSVVLNKIDEFYLKERTEYRQDAMSLAG